jgi:glycosyltransferase involved in cell wall biosynthesis
MNKRSLDIILVAYNEIETIEAEIETIFQGFTDKNVDFRIIVAEDGSQDGTSEILMDLAHKYSGKVVHVFSRNRRGFIQAQRDALRISDSDYVIFLDAGSKFYLEDIIRIFDQRGVSDVIISVRKSRTDQLIRRILTLGFNLFIRFYFNVNTFNDIDSGLKIMNRRSVEKILNYEPKFRHLVATEYNLQLLFNNFSVAEFPVKYKQRRGKSRGINLNSLFKIVIEVIYDCSLLKKSIRKG